MTKNNKIVSAWLGLMCLLIVLMILIGGFTRLTDAGLSITEWNPVTGILPPLSENGWNIEFEKYKNSPEYQVVNFSMKIGEFKSIYLIEFAHRVMGRISGLLYVIPLLIFYLKGYIKPDIGIYLGGLFLFLCQGVMGWYMVKSGLVLDPYVSHYRLAAHLLIALLLYSLFFWQFMRNSLEVMILPSSVSVYWTKFWCKIAMILLFLQIIVGAFVAGLDAGLVYNNFPLMGESFIPDEIKLSSLSLASFSNPVFVQFAHRINAYLLAFIIIILCITGRRMTVFMYVFIALLLQVFVGIITLIYNVPIGLALLHQFGAVLLLTCLLWAYFLLHNAVYETPKNNS